MFHYLQLGRLPARNEEEASVSLENPEDTGILALACRHVILGRGVPHSAIGVEIGAKPLAVFAILTTTHRTATAM